jgi:hypothetical protein
MPNEKSIALMEGHLVSRMNGYFNARPQLLRTRELEHVYEAGFKAAWQATMKKPIQENGIKFLIRAMCAEAPEPPEEQWDDLINLVRVIENAHGIG